MTGELVHEPDASRYVLKDRGQIVALAEYSINGHSISFHHTYTQPARRGHGYAADVVEYAVNDVETTSDRRILPMCWYVAEWFDRHPERSALLTR